ncbi:dTDP-4-dehydrorhamnose reductase [Noviherbaspirillum aridicola]|nr:dTDP-4-dehydrorhamnose reductase [Noviherbaspirillum aridicola]
MRILLLGKDGQVGWELQRALAPLGQVVSAGRGQADFEQPDQVLALVRQVMPHAIVNAAGYTAVDRAQTDEARARRVNAETPAALAVLAQEIGAWLVHYSTDYVFDGTAQGPYTEEDVPNPLSVYGASKLDGEIAVRELASRHLVFRTSWVHAARGANFAKTMLRLARERDVLKVVADQVGAPTGAELIADITALALHRVLRMPDAGFAGVYHLAAAGETTWHGYARHVLSRAARQGAVLRAGADAVIPVPSAEYPTAAVRPRNSRLACGKIEQAFGVVMPAWQIHVDRMVDELASQGVL